jgi:hypothetical protein
MNAVSVFPAAPSFDSFGSREADPMPETKTRRTIKASKAHIARLKRQVKAEEQRIRLQEEASYLESKLSYLRDTVGSSSYNGR